MNINFTGDLMFGDQPVKFGFGFDSLHNSKGYTNIFNGVKDVFNEADYNIANFETVIRTRPTDANISNWSMCCDSQILSELKKCNTLVVNVANNHTMDYGQDVFLKMIELFEENDIAYFGTKNKPYIFLKDDEEKICLLGISSLKVKEKKPLYSTIFDLNFNNLKIEFEKEKITKLVIYVHWGSEFIYYPTEEQLGNLDILMTLKPDLIVGNHAHIIQYFCRYKNVPVFFSLGNFISDYWQMRTRKTFILNYNSLSNDFIKVDCEISKKKYLPQVINQEKIVLEEITDFSKITSSSDIFKNRWRLRFEYLFYIILNFYKIKKKGEFIKWIWGRIIYVLNNFNKEKRNPNIIYEKY